MKLTLNLYGDLSFNIKYNILYISIIHYFLFNVFMKVAMHIVA